MDIGIAGIIVALITGISSIVTAIIWGYVPKQRKRLIKQLQKELLDVYIDVYNLKAVEECLEKENGISKSSAREGVAISSRLEKRRIEKRIAGLQSALQE